MDLLFGARLLQSVLPLMNLHSLWSAWIWRKSASETLYDSQMNERKRNCRTDFAHGNALPMIANILRSIITICVWLQWFFDFLCVCLSLWNLHRLRLWFLFVFWQTVLIAWTRHDKSIYHARRRLYTITQRLTPPPTHPHSLRLCWLRFVFFGLCFVCLDNCVRDVGWSCLLHAVCILLNAKSDNKDFVAFWLHYLFFNFSARRRRGYCCCCSEFMSAKTTCTISIDELFKCSIDFSLLLSPHGKYRSCTGETMYEMLRIYLSIQKKNAHISDRKWEMEKNFAVVYRVLKHNNLMIDTFVGLWLPVSDGNKSVR